MYECFAIFLRVTEFFPPMSRRQVTNRRELLLPLLIPDRHQRGVVFNPCVPPGPVAATNGKAGESPEAWARHSALYGAAKQASQTTEVAIAELISRNHLLARLVWQRIRQRTHSGMIGGQSCSSDEPQQARASMASPEIAMPQCAEVRVSAPIPPTIETLFTQLVRRRLRNRAAEETR